MEAPATRLLEVAAEVTAAWADTLIRRALKGHEVDEAQRSIIVERVSREVRDGLNNLLATDPELQRTNPLTVFRWATAPITEFLTGLKIPPVHRDEFEQRSFPDDMYGLYPATWADISDKLVEPGLEWGAWKAAVIISRHRSTNQDPDQSARLKP